MKTSGIKARRALVAVALTALLCALPITAYAQTDASLPPIPTDGLSTDSLSINNSSSTSSSSQESASSSSLSSSSSASSSQASSQSASSSSPTRVVGLPVTGVSNGPLKLAGAAATGVALVLCAAVVSRHKKKD